MTTPNSGSAPTQPVPVTNIPAIPQYDYPPSFPPVDTTYYDFSRNETIASVWDSKFDRY